MIEVTAQSGNVKASLHFDFDYNTVSDLDHVHEALDLLMDQYEDLVKETECGICGTYAVLEYENHIELAMNIKADEEKVITSFQEHLNECETRAQDRKALQEQWDSLDEQLVNHHNGVTVLDEPAMAILDSRMEGIQNEIRNLEPAHVTREREKYERDNAWWMNR